MFQYAPALLTRFPRTIGGVILACNMTNRPSPDSLQHTYRLEQEAVLARVGNIPLSEIPSLAAWRSTFRAFGVAPTKYRSAAEALMRRLTKKGDIPSINALVDIGNLISIRYGIPSAVFDTRALSDVLTVRFASGDERFTELGEDTIKHPEPGEVIFADETGLVFARRWCWKQSVQSAARPDTTHAIIVAEAQHASGREDIENAIADLTVLLQGYVGGEFESAILTRDRPMV